MFQTTYSSFAYANFEPDKKTQIIISNGRLRFAPRLDLRRDTE